MALLILLGGLFFYVNKYKNFSGIEGDNNIIVSGTQDDLEVSANEESSIGQSENTNTTTSSNSGSSSNSSTTDTTSGTNTTTNTSSATQSSSGEKLFTSKIGVKIYYPGSYVYNSAPIRSTQERNDCKVQQAQSGEPVDGICPTTTLNEHVKFGFSSNTNLENVYIITNNIESSNQEDICPSGEGTLNTDQGGTINIETIQVGVKSVKHYSFPFQDTEYYCLVTPDYYFQLARNQYNKTKIDVNKIVFP